MRQSDILAPQNVKSDQITAVREAEPKPVATDSQPQSSVELLSGLQQGLTPGLQETTHTSQSNLAILSQPVSNSGVNAASVPPNSNLAILSQPVVSGDPRPQPVGAINKLDVVTRPQAVGASDGEDPYLDKGLLDRFVDEVERLEKYVEGLNRQMLSGPTVLDGVWKVSI